MSPYKQINELSNLGEGKLFHSVDYQLINTEGMR